MLTVLETVARNGPIKAADVARVCNLNRTVAHRLLVTLAQRAYVRRRQDGYILGGTILDIAKYIDTDIAGIARPFMEALAGHTGETVVLHCIDKDEAVVAAQALGQRHLVRVQHTPGSRHALTAGASGWSLLSFQDPATINRVVQNTSDPEAVLRRIEETRLAGYAESHDELQMGVHGVAAPLINDGGRCMASLGILVPTSRAASIAEHRSKVLSTSHDISEIL